MKRMSAGFFSTFVLASSLLLAGASAAQAHDEIVSTTPAASSQVAAGVLKVSVTFNEPILVVADNAGLAIQVTDPAGNVMPSACLSVEGVTLWAAVDATTPGTYKVDWRSVSSDGHENSGTFDFEVADGAAAGETPANNDGCLDTLATPSATAQAITMTQATPLAGSTDSTGSTSSNSKLDPLAGLGLGIGLFIGLSLISVAAVELQKRARSRKAEQKKLKAEVEANPEMLRDL